MSLIVIREPKKSGSRRQVYVESSIINGKTRKSLKNYVDHIRCKLVTQYSDDYLFITPSEGKPFSRAYLRKILSTMGKKVYPEYQPYCMRHWCGISILIDSWLTGHPDPLRRTQRFLGHEERGTTEGYITQAESLYRQFPCNWRGWVLKRPTMWDGGKPTEIKTTPRNLCFEWRIRREGERICRDLNPG
ncbi:MAG TPA: site-specific integrase [Thermoplasmatales archaeon]|nr:site-specific integrase [Thermoplasmatales archaeon]